MLRTRPIRHFSNDLDKSWTVDDCLDLVIWYDATGDMYGFQLCYDRFGHQRAVTWTHHDGFSHSYVHSSGGLGAGMSPVLRSCDDFPWRLVLREFMMRSQELDPAIRMLIRDMIKAYGPKYPEPSP